MRLHGGQLAMLVTGSVLSVCVLGFSGLVVILDYPENAWAGWLLTAAAGGTLWAAVQSVWWWFGRGVAENTRALTADPSANPLADRTDPQRSPWPTRVLIGVLILLTWRSWTTATDAMALAEEAEDQADAVRQELQSVQSDVQELWQRVP